MIDNWLELTGLTVEIVSFPFLFNLEKKCRYIMLNRREIRHYICMTNRASYWKNVNHGISRVNRGGGVLRCSGMYTVDGCLERIKLAGMD